MFGKLALVFCICFISAQAEIELPEHISKHLCHKSDPHYNDCLADHMEAMRPYIVKGIKELNFPPLDPLEVDYFAINRTIGDAIDIRLVLRNLRLEGIKDVIFQRVKGDPYKLKGETNLLVPKVHLTLEYDIEGTIFSSPINMQGTLDGTFVDIAIATRTAESRYMKDGVEYFKLDKFDIKFAIGDGRIKLTGSTPEQQATADFIQNLFNNNPRGIIDAIAPIAIEQSKGMFMDHVNNVLAQIPAAKLLPE